MRKVRSRALATVFVAAVLATSCASGSGGTYRAGSADESAAAAASARAKEKRETQEKRPSPPTGGAASGGFFFGPGIIVVEEEQRLPEPPPGLLILHALDGGATVFLDGLPQSWSWMDTRATIVSVTPGHHTVVVRRFGYYDWMADFDAQSGVPVDMSPVLVPAAFTVMDFAAWPRAFNPLDPGFYGTTILTLEVAAPGECSIRLLAEDGRPIRRTLDVFIDARLWTWRWDGRNDHGEILPAGHYVAVATGKDGVELGRAAITINQELQARSSTLASGTGGALFVPAARAMESGGVEISSSLLGHVLSSAAPPTGRLLAGLGARFGIPLDRSPALVASGSAIEFDLSVFGIFHPGESAAVSSDAASITAAVLVPLETGPVFISMLGKFSYGTFITAGDWPSPFDGATRFPGLSFALPLEVDTDTVRGFLAPEIEVSTFYPEYDPARVPGFYTWAYLRGGFESKIGPLSLALSGALRSLPLDQGLALSRPIPAGLELRWHSSTMPLVVSFLLTGEFDWKTAWYLNSGISVGCRL